MLKVLFLMILAAAVACSSTESTSAKSEFWDTDSDVRGVPALRVNVIRELSKIVENSDAVVVVHVGAVADVSVAGPLSEPVVVVDETARDDFERLAAAAALAPTGTTYLGEVKQWIKGAGQSDIRIRGIGGVAADGTLHVIDGTFLLEAGRTYLLALVKGDGGEFVYGPARSAFDLTDGVKVLNHPDTRDLEHFEEISVDEFVDYVAALAGP